MCLSVVLKPARMSQDTNHQRVRTARRAGMMVLLVIIAWTIGAVTIGVLRGPIEQAANVVDSPEG